MLATLASLCLLLPMGTPYPRLDASSWKERERATLVLARGGMVAFRLPQDEEVQARIRQAKSVQQRKAWEAQWHKEQAIRAKALRMFPSGWKQHPWIDRAVLGDDIVYYDIMHTELYCYCCREDMQNAPWLAWRYATYLWIKRMLHAGKSEQWIQRKLDVLAWVEYDWVKAENHCTDTRRLYVEDLPMPKPPQSPRPLPVESKSSDS